MSQPTFRKTIQCTASFAALALLAPLAALAGEPSEYLWDGAIARGATVEVVNPIGDVFVQRSESGRVELRALRSAVTGDPSLIEMRTVRTDGGLAICSEAPSSTFTCVAGARPSTGSTNYRVDELVQVPAGTTVIVRGQTGKIVIEDGASGSSANGEVRTLISPAGAATKPLVFTARNGAITPA
jgi:hypothetical protein